MPHGTHTTLEHANRFLDYNIKISTLIPILTYLTQCKMNDDDYDGNLSLKIVYKTNKTDWRITCL